MNLMTAEQFLADVSNHKMAVKLDNGLYRHLMLRQPGNSNMWFEIVTWPGRLTVSGDMGTWTFARLEDMFKFFRDGKMRINADYWSEKIEQGVHGGRNEAKVFSEDLFKKQLLDRLAGYELHPDDLAEVTEALQDEVLNQDCKYDLLIAARDFKHRFDHQPGDQRRYFQFDSCDLPSGKEYSYHFLWCLYAIVWAIQQYDAVRRDQPALEPESVPT